MNWDLIVALAPVGIAILLFLKRMTAKRRERVDAGRVRRGETFRRDYEPIEPK